MFRLVSTFLFPYCIVLYIDVPITVNRPLRFLHRVSRHRRRGAVARRRRWMRSLEIASRAALCGRARARRKKKNRRERLPLITDNMKVTSTRSSIVFSNIVPQPDDLATAAAAAATTSAAGCRRRNINIYRKITFLATAHFITHIAAIFAQDTRVNYYVYVPRTSANKTRRRAPSRKYRPCVAVSRALDTDALLQYLDTYNGRSV